MLPDTRFPNEVNMIKSIGGAVWCVKRGENPFWFDQYLSKRIEPKDVHPSEWAWAHSDFNVVIENNSSLSDLHSTISKNIIDLR
jgi:hypothetical protein